MSVNVWDKKNNKLIPVAGLVVASTTEYVSVANMPTKSTCSTKSITGAVVSAEMGQAIIGEVPWNNTIVNSETSSDLAVDDISVINGEEVDTTTTGEPPLPMESMSNEDGTIGEPPLADTESEEQND